MKRTYALIAGRCKKLVVMSRDWREVFFLCFCIALFIPHGLGIGNALGYEIIGNIIKSNANKKAMEIAERRIR